MDNTDLKIISLLQANGRIAMKDLAKEVNMSAPATAERVRKLEEAGVIKGYSADVDWEKLGYPVHAYMAATVANASARKDFYAYVQAHPLIKRVSYVMSGGPDAVLEIYCHNMEELAEVQKALFDRVHTLTYLVQNKLIKDELSGSLDAAGEA